MDMPIDNVATQALSILNKELEKRGLKVDDTALTFYKKYLTEVLREERTLFESYRETPIVLKDDVQMFVSNLVRVRERMRAADARVPRFIDIKQLKQAFAKCGPHRIRC